MTEGEQAHWFVLEHRPGPAVPPGGSVFEQPGFGEHVAFLHRLHADGRLVAAGPLPDEEGTGMTVVRVLGDDTELITRMATQEDASVTSGVLQVRVRPWQVILHAARDA